MPRGFQHVTTYVMFYDIGLQAKLKKQVSTFKILLLYVCVLSNYILLVTLGRKQNL